MAASWAEADDKPKGWPESGIRVIGALVFDGHHAGRKVDQNPCFGCYGEIYTGCSEKQPVCSACEPGYWSVKLILPDFWQRYREGGRSADSNGQWPVPAAGG